MENVAGMVIIHKRLGRPTKAESQQKSLVKQQRASGNVARRKKLPECFLPDEIQWLLREAENPDCAMSMMLGWRASLRISESLSIQVSDVQFNAEPPVIRIRQGKGSEERIVPLHPELSAFISNHILYTGRKTYLIGNS